jgi:hypothetical protein
VTNHHVIDGCGAIEVVAADGRRPATVVDAVEQIDLALLRVYGLRGGVASLRTKSATLLGESATVFGFPLGGALSSTGNFTTGVVSSLRGLRDAAGEIQITAPVQPGNSGGPVLDRAGSVIGVVQGKLDKSLMAQLANCQWIHNHQNLILTGATGCGKTWLSCALGNAACRQGLSVTYVRTPRLFEELRIAHGDGSFGKRLSALAKTDLLILDDWGLAPLDQGERNDLLEVLDDRVATRSTLITSQLPTEHWHDYLNDPNLADASLDRILHVVHKISLSGESLRKQTKDIIKG